MVVAAVMGEGGERPGAGQEAEKASGHIRHSRHSGQAANLAAAPP